MGGEEMSPPKGLQKLAVSHEILDDDGKVIVPSILITTPIERPRLKIGPPPAPVDKTNARIGPEPNTTRIGPAPLRDLTDTHYPSIGPAPVPPIIDRTNARIGPTPNIPDRTNARIGPASPAAIPPTQPGILERLRRIPEDFMQEARTNIAEKQSGPAPGRTDIDLPPESARLLQRSTVKPDIEIYDDDGNVIDSGSASDFEFLDDNGNPIKLGEKPLGADLLMHSEKPKDLGQKIMSAAGSAYNAAFEAPKFVTDAADKLTEDMVYSKYNPAFTEDENRWDAMTKAFIGQSVRGIAEQLSPVNLLTLGTGGWVAPIARWAGRAQIGHGLADLAQGEYSKGAADIGFGLLGLAGNRRGVKLPGGLHVPESERINLPKTPPGVPSPAITTPKKPRYRLTLDGKLEPIPDVTPERLPTTEGRPAEGKEILSDVPDLNGQTLMTGERVQQMLGVSPNEAIARGWVQFEDSGNGVAGYRLIQNRPDLALPTGTTERLPVTETTPTGRTVSASSGQAPAMGMFGEALPPEANAVDNWWNRVTRSNRPARSGNVDVSTLDNPVAKIIVKLRQSRVLNKEQAALLTAQRGRKAGELEKAAGRGSEYLKNVKAALYGKLPGARFEPLEFDENDLGQLTDIITQSDMGQFEKARAMFAIEKLMNGQVPQRNEVQTLSSLFTKRLTRDLKDPNVAQDIVGQLVSELHAKKPMDRRAGRGLDDLQRTMMSSMDMSAPLSSGATGLMNKEWYTAWGSMFKALGKEGARAVEASIQTHPNYHLWNDSPLSLTNIADTGLLREEGFGSALAEKWIPGVKRSEQAYGAFMNKYRFDLANRLLKEADKIGYKGVNAEERDLYRKIAIDAIAEHVNVITGRANLGRLEKYSGLLNDAFYAPRQIASNVEMLKMLNPMWYPSQPSYIRKQALKSLLSKAFLATAVNGAGLAAGGTVEHDPRKSDFGQLRFGKTTIDASGSGTTGYLVLLARMIAQSTVSQNNNVREFNGKYGSQNGFNLLVNFLVNKASPNPSLTIKELKKFDPVGNRYNMPVETAKTFIPMIMSDIASVFQEDKDWMPETPKDLREIAAIPAIFFGARAQSYR
jgi:hypothetical protein